MRTLVVLALLSGCTISQSAGTFADPVTAEDVIECEPDSTCPTNSYCAADLGMCFTDAKCMLNGGPSNMICRNAFGPNFGCYEDAPESFHCVPTRFVMPPQP